MEASAALFHPHEMMHTYVIRPMTFPDFTKPPVVEVVCGVLFDPPGGFMLPHIGQFSKRLGHEFPKISEVNSLPPVVETFKDRPQNLVFGRPPLPRVWFENTAGDQLVQLQRDRLLVNWKKTTPEHAYPRFPAVNAAFEKHLELFNAFMTETFGQAPPHRQYELTYINHIPADDTWQALEDIGGVLPDLAWRKKPDRFLPGPERLEARLVFPFPDQAGRLHVRVQHGTRSLDQVPILVVDLTARGFLVDRKAWFDLAHEWIVKGFCDLTETRIQNDVWERTN